MTTKCDNCGGKVRDEEGRRVIDGWSGTVLLVYCSQKCWEAGFEGKLNDCLKDSSGGGGE